MCDSSFPKPARRGGLHLGTHLSRQLHCLGMNPNLSNRTAFEPDRIQAIHQEYIGAGAKGASRLRRKLSFATPSEAKLRKQVPFPNASICLAFDIATAVRSKAAEHWRTPKPAGHYALVSPLAFLCGGLPRH